MEPIVTGETLDLQEEQDPFTNSGDSYPEEDYLPPSPDSSYANYDYDADIADSYNSHGSYHPPSGMRSRSPTPAVDDEDYHIVGEDSIHYIRNPKPVFDEEKGYMNEKLHSFYGSYDGSSSTSGEDPETPLDRLHFGPAPTGRISRRHNDAGPTKRIQLTEGNLVVDLPVPPRLILPYKGEHETLHTTYSGVTCDPDDFEANGFKLRQVGRKRQTEIMIVVTLFNVCPVSPQSFVL